MRQRVFYARSECDAKLVGLIFESPDSERLRIIKDEGRSLAGFFETADGKAIFFKRTEARSWGRGIVERLLGSRARRALRGAALLERSGFCHPAPLAAAELIEAGAVRRSLLLSERLTNADSLSRSALGPNGERRSELARRRAIIRAVAAEVRRLHDAGLLSRDLQETNLMLREDRCGGFDLYFVDLEDFRKPLCLSRRRRLLNLVHLDRSAGRFLPRSDRLRFLKHYLGPRAGHDELLQAARICIRLRARIDCRKGRAASILPVQAGDRDANSSRARRPSRVASGNRNHGNRA